MTTTESHNKPSLNQFLEMQLQLFKGHFLVTQASMDEEAIHRMRLSIKRIRTIRKLKKHIHFPITLASQVFEAMKAVFEASGHLRDLQVQLGLLTDYSKEMKFSFIFFRNYFAEKEKILREQLDKTIHEINPDLFTDLHAVPENPPSQPDNAAYETESLDFVKFLIAQIQELIVQPGTSKNIHKLRKRVKQLYFVLQFLRDYFPGSIGGNYNLLTLRSVGESLGHWHDRITLKDALHEFTAKMGESFLIENPEYQILLYVLEREKEKFLRGLDVKLYLEIINLRFLAGERTPQELLQPLTPDLPPIEICG